MMVGFLKLKCYKAHSIRTRSWLCSTRVVANLFKSIMDGKTGPWNGVSVCRVPKN